VKSERRDKSDQGSRSREVQSLRGSNWLYYVKRDVPGKVDVINSQLRSYGEGRDSKERPNHAKKVVGRSRKKRTRGCGNKKSDAENGKGEVFLLVHEVSQKNSYGLTDYRLKSRRKEESPREPLHSGETLWRRFRSQDSKKKKHPSRRRVVGRRKAKTKKLLRNCKRKHFLPEESRPKREIPPAKESTALRTVGIRQEKWKKNAAGRTNKENNTVGHENRSKGLREAGRGGEISIRWANVGIENI